MKFLLAAALLAAVVALASADCYMHNMRGSNDRLNENNGNRQNANRLFDSQNNAAGGYAWGPMMYFYAGSYLDLEWSVQHGCGSRKSNCQLIIQYTCDDLLGEPMRDGTVTTTVPDNANTQSDPQYGRVETHDYYNKCKNRDRNRGLYIADRNVGNAARNTRQNNGGTRSGFECPEERDYYPYWHPTPWVDVAVITDEPGMCDWYQEESENVKGRGLCSAVKYNNPTACAQNGGTWEEKAAHNEAAPDCVQSSKTFVNHLGRGENGQFSSYRWKLPENRNGQKCMLRFRYNISTAETDFFMDASKNKGASPVKQDQIVDYGGNLSLALNTNQYGRTFQDRSYAFEMRARPENIPAEAVIHNLNVRGKRGNIVQSYPAVEYDWIPNELQTKEGEYVHFQWTGSKHNNGGNGNNNGEGIDGTDRHNMCEMEDLDYSKCRDYDSATFFDDADTKRAMAHPAQTSCLTYAQLLAKHNNNQNDIEDDVQNCMKLNNGDNGYGYYDGGLMRMNKTGEWYFLTTRNNNFSNRSQKMTIVVDPPIPLWAAFLIGIGAGMMVLGGAGGYAYSKGQLPFFNAPAGV